MQWTDPAYLANLIQSCDDRTFVALCNDLLSETAAHNHIDRSCLATNLHISEPDGGIDARCENAPATVGRLIPHTHVAYQFKSGNDRKSSTKIATEDMFEKPRVKEWLLQGKVFVYMAAWDRGDKIEEKICEGVRKLGIPVSNGQIIFIGRDIIARLLQAFPGIIARYMRFDVPLLSLEEWANFRTLINPFKADTAVNLRLSDLIEACANRCSLKSNR